MENELKIKYYCIKNGYDYRYFSDVAVIVTKIDSWKLEFVDVYNKDSKQYDELIRVKHMNKAGNKKGKAHFHSQRVAYDIDYVFNSIIAPHEEGDRVYQKAFRIKELLAKSI